jgi:hypothetical protein
MTHIKPLARFIYASAFFIPFFWVVTSDAPTPNDITQPYRVDASDKETRFATVDQVFAVPLENDISNLTLRAGLIPQASGGL